MNSPSLPAAFLGSPSRAADLNLNQVQAGLDVAGVPSVLTKRLLGEYVEAKRRFHLGDHQPTAVDAGRFAEAALRIVEHALFQSHTPLTKSLSPLNAQRLAAFEAATSARESLRIHIPRALFSVYAIRNKRDAAHLNDGIDANLQDATYVIGVLDWVLAEFVRIYHNVSPAVAQTIIDNLVVREVPVIEEIDGQPVLSTNLGVSDQILVFLYRTGRDDGLAVAELQRQMRHPDRSNLTKAVKNLDKKGLVLLHPSSGKAHITSSGMADVETRHLLSPGTSRRHTEAST